VRALHRIVLALALATAPIVLALGAGDAGAAVPLESPYTYEQTFGTAVRLLHVDLGLKITEKDVDGGFVLFDYTSPESGKRVTKGSLELVRSRAGVHVSVQLPAMPSYHEQMIVDALARKLLAEHGEPPKPKAPAPPPADADAGTDAETPS
jgi:hypothetical protein